MGLGAKGGARCRDGWHALCDAGSGAHVAPGRRATLYRAVFPRPARGHDDSESRSLHDWHGGNTQHQEGAGKWLL